MKKTLVVLVVALVAGLVQAAPADALSRCGKRLVNDWYDGRIDNRYPVRCYHDAIRFARANPDLNQYSSLEEDLRRALRSSLRRGGFVRAGARGRRGGPRDPQVVAERREKAIELAKAKAEALARAQGEEDSLPIPLLVLGALGALLLAAGLGGYVRRWMNRAQPEMPPAEPGPET